MLGELVPLGFLAFGSDLGERLLTVPSDAILTTLLTAGAVLILAGALFGRLASIKLLGAEITLTPEEANKTAEKAAKKIGDKSAGAAAEDLPKIFNHVRQRKCKEGIVEFSDRQLDRVVGEAVEQIS